MWNRLQLPYSWRYLTLLLIADLCLLLPNASTPRVIGALLLIGLLPGMNWANYFLPDLYPLARLSCATALSYLFTSFTTLLLHYLAGPVYQWQIVVVLNFLALLPILIDNRSHVTTHRITAKDPITIPAVLITILLLALGLRLANLHYSEFQGDEALAMITAAEALEGHEDALFLRSKGPGEVLLPMALWRLTGAIDELIVRLPFAIATLFATITIYLIGQTIGGQKVGWLAAGFFAFNGFTVAFGRIVQYQALVVWLSALAFFLALQWQITSRNRLALLSGLCLGGALLAHYDAILVLPAIGWLFIAPGFNFRFSKEHSGKPFKGTPDQISPAQVLRIPAQPVKAILLFATAFLTSSLLFYLPYALDPQANRTGDYVGNRIGDDLRNNLPDFFHFNTFYSSSYYIILSGILVMGLLTWRLWQARRSHWSIALLIATASLVAILNPDFFSVSEETIDLTFLPFTLLCLGAFVAFAFGSGQQALIGWLAVPFLGYNFVVALGLTHIYTIVPAWSLLAALGWQVLIDAPLRGLQGKWPIRSAYALLTIGLLLSTIFLWNSFIRHDIEYWQDYPAGNLSFFWNPYKAPPKAGFFGFAHRTGWKAVGQKIVSGELQGDYGSNEEPDITTWYTRGAPRACDPKPEFYFLADDIIDQIDVPADIIETHYETIGTVTLSNQKQLQIVQQSPIDMKLEPLNEAALAGKFDQTAIPSAFARSARGSVPVEANFGNLVRLIGYDLDTRRARAGGRIPVTLYWQPLAQIPTSYQIFTHLESDTGPVAQSDGVPVCWTYPTDAWRPGQIIADQHAIMLPADLHVGAYPLEVGLYLPGTFERLDIIDEAGNPADTSIILTTIVIKDQDTEVEN